MTLGMDRNTSILKNLIIKLYKNLTKIKVKQLQGFLPALKTEERLNLSDLYNCEDLIEMQRLL